MNSFLIFLFLILTVVIDYFWLDTDRRRWGWMKNWSKRNKVLFFTGFIAVSIGELLVHIANICKADLLIANGATQDEMDQFYSSVEYRGINEIKTGILNNFILLEETYLNYSEKELQQRIASFWGVSYSRYEWLLELLAHVYHHRGQLHAILVHYYNKDPKVLMFE